MIRKIAMSICCIFACMHAEPISNSTFTATPQNTTLQNNMQENEITLRLENVLRNDSGGLSLKELLNSANNNYALQAQDLLARQADKDHLVQIMALIPTLDAKYNFNHSSASVPMSYTTQNAQLAFNMKLDYADYNAIREKGATATKASYDSKYTKQSIYLQVVQQYYTYFSNESKLLTLEQKLEQINSDVDRVQKLYNQGLKTIADLESLKSQAALTQYQIDDAKLALEQSKLMLEYLTNTKIESLKRVQIESPSFKLQDRDDIKSLEYQVQAQKYLNKQLHYFPVLNIQDSYTYNIQIPDFAKGLISGNTLPPSFLMSYADHQNTFSVVVSYGLFAKIGQSMQKQSFRLAQLATEKNLAYKKNEQKKDEELYRKAIEVAQNQIKSAKASLISANLSYDNMKKRYDANLVTFTEYLQALSTKYDAESTFIQALNNYEIQKANYIFYSGQELEQYIQ
ncbi:TolC family protein [Helicobacter bilis]|uniref:TolC family protein n=1 Tax=Helicobacter bilis TaxID=37372 RepID=UPI002557D9D7|nr:TolC family protein [Helicobacter bilis]